MGLLLLYSKAAAALFTIQIVRHLVICNIKLTNSSLDTIATLEILVLCRKFSTLSFFSIQLATGTRLDKEVSQVAKSDLQNKKKFSDRNVEIKILKHTFQN